MTTPTDKAPASVRDEDAPPREVQAIASAERLGRRLAVFRRVNRPVLITCWAVLGLFPFAFLAGTAPLATLVVGVVFWPVAIWGLIQNSIFAGSVAAQRIHLYERGFVHTRAKGAADLYRWDRVSTLYERIWIRAGIRTHRILVVRADGTTIKLTNAWGGIERLMGEVGTRVTRVQLPVVRAALDQGHGVRFGGLVIDANAVASPRQSAPWSRVELVRSHRGTITVLAAGSFLPLASTPVGRIPNVRLFLTIFRMYRQPGRTPDISGPADRTAPSRPALSRAAR